MLICNNCYLSLEIKRLFVVCLFVCLLTVKPVEQKKIKLYYIKIGLFILHINFPCMCFFIIIIYIYIYTKTYYYYIYIYKNLFMNMRILPKNNLNFDNI